MGNRSAADAGGLLAGPGAAALVGGVLLIGAVLAGNSLVCVSVATERALQTPTNSFIVSLAAADLLLALLVLPLFVYSEVQGGAWLLSPRLCDALMAMDVMLCTASILNLCAISVDRFVAVAVPLRYNRQGGSRRQLLLIGATWLLSAAVAAPVLCGLNDVRGRDPAVCRLEDRDYVVYSSVCSFFLPCPLMLLLYWATFRGLRRWEVARRAKLHRRAPPAPGLPEGHCGPDRAPPAPGLPEGHCGPDRAPPVPGLPEGHCGPDRAPPAPGLPEDPCGPDRAPPVPGLPEGHCGPDCEPPAPGLPRATAAPTAPPSPASRGPLRPRPRAPRPRPPRGPLRPRPRAPRPWPPAGPVRPRLCAL
ncbi:D dopamine receptor [Plecturocebus cupreus]